MEPSLLVAYLAIGVCALAPIVFGSIDSIRAPRTVRRARRKAAKADESSSDEEEVERLTSTDAALFPILGSVALLGLYLAYRYISKELLDRLLTFYFSIIGLAAVARWTADIGVRSGTRTGTLASGFTKLARFSKYHLRLTKAGKSDLVHVRFTIVDLGALVWALVATIAQVTSRHWTLTNIIALSIGFNAISLLRIDSFRTGFLLLALLFVYDVWWVFGTEVMVTVAKQIDGPIKIQVPKSFIDPKAFTMLGLGDIVLPGIFVALCARFDYAQILSRSAGKPPLPHAAHDRPYFYSCLAAYVLGLASTIAVMQIFNAAQPALLYLSPACILSVLITALMRGEVKSMLAYDDGAQAEQDKKDREDEKEAAKRLSPAKKDLLPPAPDKSTELHVPKPPLMSTEEEMTPSSEADDEMTAGEGSSVRRRRSRRKNE